MADTFNSELALKLQSLPISVGKILLWLTYRGVKPMASIVLTFDWNSDPAKQKELVDWFTEGSIYYEISQKSPNALHVSLDPKNLTVNKEVELDDSPKGHQVRGNLYGFPLEASRIYAQEMSEKENPFPSKLIIHAQMVPQLEKEYWYPYIEYLVRRGHELEDSMVAKKWADVARQEIPIIAQEYEEERKKMLMESRVELIKLYNNSSQ